MADILVILTVIDWELNKMNPFILLNFHNTWYLNLVKGQPFLLMFV